MKDNWVEKEISLITNLLKDGTHGTHSDVSEGIPLLSAKDIVNGKISILDDARKISQNDYNSIHSNYLPEVGDVLLTLVGTIGRTAIIKDYSQKFTFQRSVGILRFSKEVYNEYAYHYINSEIFKLELDRATNASAQGGVYLGSLGKIKIAYPKSLQKQQKIAKILSTCDEVIEKTEAAIAKYKAIKQGMMHDLFTRGIDVSTGKLRPSYQEAPELYKESELGMIPKEWEVESIQDFAGHEKYSIVDGPFGSNLKTIHYKSFGYPIIQSGFVTSNEFHANNYLYVDSEKYFSEIRSSVKGGDIIMAKIGAQCGTCAALPLNHQDSIIAGNCLKISVNHENSSNYLLNILHFFRIQGKLDLIISTTAQPAISMSALKNMSIQRPLKNEQDKICEKIESLKTKIQAEVSSLSKYKKLKEGLMQDLLTGKVEVSE